MAFKLALRTRELVTTTGAIDVASVISIAGPTNSDLVSFVNTVGDGNQTIVCIVSGDNIAWAECVVTIADASPDTLTVNSILANNLGTTAGISLTGATRVFGVIPQDWDILFDLLYGTAIGSLFYRSAGGVWTALPRGPAGSVLRSSATTIEWEQQTMKEAAAVAASSPLPNSPVYDNGTAGDGATLTAGSNGIPTIDGVNAFTVGYRVLVAGQADPVENGIYEFTTIGAGVPYVLTRSTDFDGSAVAAGGVELGNTISVYSGTANKGLWAFTAFTPAGTITFGTSELTFEIIASSGGGGGGITNIASATDVTITSLADYDILVNVSGDWVNSRPPYVFAFSAPQTTPYSASQVIGHHRAAAAITIGANFAAYLGLSSQAGGSAVATASTVISIEKAASATPTTFSQIGTVTIAAASVTPTFATASGAAQNIAQGDIIRVVMPASPDTTFAGFNMTVIASRQ